jgi:hypothetical protein
MNLPGIMFHQQLPIVFVQLHLHRVRQRLLAREDHGMLDGGLRMRSMVLPDVFLDHDSPGAMYARAGLDAKGIVAKVFETLGKDFKVETVKLA